MKILGYSTCLWNTPSPLPSNFSKENPYAGFKDHKMTFQGEITNHVIFHKNGELHYQNSLFIPEMIGHWSKGFPWHIIPVPV